MSASAGNIRQRGRERRNRRRQDQGGITQTPFKPVRNPYPPVAILSDDQIEDIHLASLELLRDTGMVVLDPPSRDHLRQLGAEICADSGRVRLDPALVEEAMTDLPNGYTAIARNPEKSIDVRGDAITFASVCGPSFVSDLDTAGAPAPMPRCAISSAWCKASTFCISMAVPGSSRSICRRSRGTWT